MSPIYLAVDFLLCRH